MKKVFLLLGALFFFPHPVFALNIIRDTEIEEVLTQYVQQIFTAGNLPKENAEVILINDDSINAFVAGGQTIFVHTGLITHTQYIDDLMFVLSHETGHIIGGHITRGITAYQKAQKTALISTILGGILAVASGRPDAGIAVMMGSQTSAMGTFTSYRQVEESSADRTAVDIMQKMGYSMQGFTHIMNQIQSEERLNVSNDKSLNYLRTHPLTSDRKQNIQHFLGKTPAPRRDKKFERIKAKLMAFMLPPASVRPLYNKNTPDDIYANAILDFREHNLQGALSKLDTLLKLEPQNPYLYELKGQFEFESGKVNQAIQSYTKAVQLNPAPLIQISLAQALTEKGSTVAAQQALSLLNQAILKEGQTALPWRLMATAYDKLDQKEMAQYAMAEYYLASNQKEQAEKTAQKLLEKIDKKTPPYQKLKDILDKIKAQQD